MLQGACKLLGRGALFGAGVLFRAADELDELAERLGVGEPAPMPAACGADREPLAVPEADYVLVWARLPESYDLIDLGPVAVVTGRN